MIIFETERLIVSELTPTNDAPFILELVNSPGWLEFIGDRNIKNTEAAENYIRNGPMVSYATFGHGLYLVSLKTTGTPVGICGLIKRETLEDKDLGFAFLPQYTGQGYALEAAAATLQHARETCNVEKIAAITLHNNHRSVNLLVKLGFVFDKMIRLGGDEKELMLFVTQ